MGCTIFYKGTLKVGKTPKNVFETAKKHLDKMNATIEYTMNTINIEFSNKKNEQLTLYFKDSKIDGFCKWNGDTEEELYAIFDMFTEIKLAFKSLIISDDCGCWKEYVSIKKPCKIELIPLTGNGLKMLERIEKNESIPTSDVELFVMSKAARCMSKLLRIIAQDFIKIIGIEDINDFNPDVIVTYTNGLKFWGDSYGDKDVKTFDFNFAEILLEIWISNAFRYKEKELVKDCRTDERSLKSSKIAALWGIESIFLGYIIGAENSKHAEMIKFAKKYYKSDWGGSVMIVDTPEREVQFLFSMLNYLKLDYVGVDDNT